MIVMDWLYEERQAWEEGYRCLAGIDEAGRGALAGPVVAACVVLPYEMTPPGVNDSKALSPAQREQVYCEIMKVARGVGVGMVEAAVIDEINILQAAHRAMRLALENLPPGLFPDLALIDGLPVRPFPLTQLALVKGDSRSATIAAASIIAKVTRDRMMCAYDAEYPGYGFASHKGYGAPTHLRALKELGLCPLHRRTFRPVAECIHTTNAGEDA
jgi:ribonuclease HII